MKKLLLRLCSTALLPVAWTILTIVLLCIPGSDFPDEGSFGFQIDNLDKVVHVFLFGGIVLFWGFYIRRSVEPQLQKKIILITLFSILLGVIMEFIQLWFIPERSFDNWDIVADSFGAILFGAYHILFR
jgi:VanZ family protein